MNYSGIFADSPMSVSITSGGIAPPGCASPLHLVELEEFQCSQFEYRHVTAGSEKFADGQSAY